MMAADFCLVPGVLIALPQLRDENFERSVIMMIEHTDQGSWPSSTGQHHSIAAPSPIALSWTGPTL